MSILQRFQLGTATAMYIMLYEKNLYSIETRLVEASRNYKQKLEKEVVTVPKAGFSEEVTAPEAGVSAERSTPMFILRVAVGLVEGDSSTAACATYGHVGETCRQKPTKVDSRGRTGGARRATGVTARSEVFATTPSLRREV